jgi:hypothetical protein
MEQHEESGDVIHVGWIRNVVPMLVVVSSALVWGMKLEADRASTQVIVQEQGKQIAAMQAIIGAGILPVTDERLRASNAELAQLRHEVEQLKTDCLRLKDAQPRK